MSPVSAQRTPRSPRTAAARAWARSAAPGLVLVAVLTALAVSACRGKTEPKHRERDVGRDAQCRDPSKPRAYFYPAENRTDYRPDHPQRDGCELLVADHLFCCPDAPRATDR